MNSGSTLSACPGRILLLQGPVGPFFRILAQELRQHKFAVDHVLFNLGDLVYSNRQDIIVFRKSIDAWRVWIEEALSEKRYKAIVLFGCQREQHETARELALKYGVPVLSLEEGYIRPGYITVEPGGNNTHSPLSHLPVETFSKLPSSPRPRRTQGRAYRTMIALGAWYYVAKAIGCLWFWRVRHHKRRYVAPEALLWIRNIYRKKMREGHNKKIITRLTQNHKGKFFIVPLQVHDDLQLLKCGRGWTNERLVKETIASFSKHAADDHVLVIKAHPMERGHTAAARLVRKCAKEHTCVDRVLFLDDGLMGSLTRVSGGMVTINSTSGLSAMLHCVPLAVLGDAMYAHPQLVTRIENENQLDDFWQHGTASPKHIAHGFRAHMVVRALLPGDYYHEKDRVTASKNVVRRLLQLIEAGE